MTTMQYPRAVLFDFDGTLGQSLPHWTSAYREALQSHGVELETHEVIQACFMRSQREVLQELGLPNHESFKEGVWSRVKDRMHLVETYPDLIETVDALRAHSFAIGVVTNSRRGHVGPVLSRWDLEPHISTFVAIEDVSKGKPDPEAIHQALNHLQVPASEAWMIGDSLADINAGHAAGVKTIAFSPAENHPFISTDTLRAANPTHVADSYKDIRRIILESLR